MRASGFEVSLEPTFYMMAEIECCRCAHRAKIELRLVMRPQEIDRVPMDVEAPFEPAQLPERWRDGTAWMLRGACCPQCVDELEAERLEAARQYEAHLARKRRAKKKATSSG